MKDELKELQEKIGSAYSIMPVEQLYKINRDLTDLQAQNDELRASNLSLRKELEYFTDRVERGTITSKATYRRFKLALDKTPTQALADIRAEAVMSLMDSGLGFASEFESEWLYREEDIKDHANKVKGAE